MPINKFEYLRSNKHLDAVRSLPCCECGAGPRSQAAHINWSKFGKAMKKKASDEATIPLCLADHQAYDQSKRTREESREWFMVHLRSTAKLLIELELLGPDAKRLLIERGVL
jgi:hypothetical protein